MTDMPERIWVELTPIDLGSSDGPFWIVKSGITDIQWVGATEYVRADLPPKVKPLVWEEPCRANNFTHVAKSVFGDYYVAVDGGRHQAWMEAHVKPYERTIGPEVGRLIEAVDIAQAHYAEAVAALVQP